MVCRGLVLLNDEGSGADAAYRELLVALDRHLANLDLLDLRAARPGAEELDELRDGILGALDVRGDGCRRPRCGPIRARRAMPPAAWPPRGSRRPGRGR